MVCLLTQLLNNVHPTNESRGGGGDSSAEPSSEFAQCVEHINVLTLRLKNADERCNLLAANLRKVKATCAAQHSVAAGVPAPPPPLLLTSMMKAGGASSLSGSMSLPTTGSETPPPPPPVLYV